MRTALFLAGKKWLRQWGSAPLGWSVHPSCCGPLLSPRMGFVVYLFKPIGRNMGIDLRRYQVSVPEEFLHATKVGARIQHVSGVAVAQFVGREPGIEAARLEVTFKSQLHQAWVHGTRLFRFGEEHW